MISYCWHDTYVPSLFDSFKNLPIVSLTQKQNLLEGLTLTLILSTENLINNIFLNILHKGKNNTKYLWLENDVNATSILCETVKRTAL